MENLPQIVGKNLASLRKAKGLTQLQLAVEIHYSDKSISKWELGYATPSVDILMDFAAFYGVSLDYLVTEHDPDQIRQAIDEKAVKAAKGNRLVILSLAPTVVVLIALAVFFSGLFRSTPEYHIWAFIWMVPVGVAVSGITAMRLYHNRMVNLVLSSTFFWTLLLALCFHYAFFVEAPRNIWLTMIAGAPIQVIFILTYHLRKQRS